MIVKEKLEKALERLESAIERRISALESENSRLRAEVAKLSGELKGFSENSTKPITTTMSLTDIISQEPPLVARPHNDSEQLSDVHLSLSKLKRLVS